MANMIKLYSKRNSQQNGIWNEARYIYGTLSRIEKNDLSSLNIEKFDVWFGYKSETTAIQKTVKTEKKVKFGPRSWGKNLLTCVN